jgi:hypothetical protein
MPAATERIVAVLATRLGALVTRAAHLREVSDTRRA